MKRSNLFRTDTTRFVLPQLFNSSDVITEDFINAYMWSDRSPETECIVLVYTAPNAFLEKQDYDLKETYKNLTVYYFNISERRVFIDKFMSGKYSTFTGKEKTDILKFWNLSKHSRMHNIMYPTDFLYETSTQSTLLYTKGEIWPKPNTIKETFVYT